jgi:hypothetical protein
MNCFVVDELRSRAVSFADKNAKKRCWLGVKRPALTA